jgi:DUF971 family protein
MVNTLQIKQIKRSTESEIEILWTDEHAGPISLKILRDTCPCASCQGETVLLRTFAPQPSPEKPGKYFLSGADVVGNYALQLRWGDGHGDGLYTWEHLRSLCECSACRAVREERPLA